MRKFGMEDRCDFPPTCGKDKNLCFWAKFHGLDPHTGKPQTSLASQIGLFGE